MLLTNYVPIELLAATATLGIVVIMGLLLISGRGRTGLPRNFMRHAAPPLPVRPLGKADTVAVVEPGETRRGQAEGPTEERLPELADSFLGPVTIEQPQAVTKGEADGHAGVTRPLPGVPGDDLLPRSEDEASAARGDDPRGRTA